MDVQGTRKRESEVTYTNLRFSKCSCHNTVGDGNKKLHYRELKETKFRVSPTGRRHNKTSMKSSTLLRFSGVSVAFGIIRVILALDNTALRLSRIFTCILGFFGSAIGLSCCASGI